VTAQSSPAQRGKTGDRARAVASGSHLDVLVVGAGLSGIGAGHYLQTHCPWARYEIFEARGSVGGTWDLFRFPGIRSDSDMHTLGYSFRPWVGEESIAEGASILQYIEDTATETGVDEHIHLEHRVVAADWASDESRWHVTIERTSDGAPVETLRVTAGFLFACSGYYRYDHGYLPEFAGVDDFAGAVVHPQKWPDDLDYAGKEIVVVGSGATAVTLVPALARTAAHVTMLQRSPTYMAALPLRSPVAALLRKILPPTAAGTGAKWFHALLTEAFYKVCRRWPKQVRRMLLGSVARHLPEGYDVATHFTPRYDPWDQRFCAAPEGDFFAAICDGSVSVVTDTIQRFTRKGILLASGNELGADIIVTATGLELLFLGGMALSIDGTTVAPSQRLTYKGMMLEGVPNLAVAIGYTNASWTLKCDLTCDYVCRLLNHMRERGLSECAPRNDDPAVAVEGEPLLNLTSGYIRRGAHLLPKQGDRQPWRVSHSYLRDYRALKMSGVEDEYMVFRGPRPAANGSSWPGWSSSASASSSSSADFPTTSPAPTAA
jgi:cation diffusion facilitator CzcD-associated flavoprotein CzcO